MLKQKPTNLWFPGLKVLLDFNTAFKIPQYQKRVDITERRYSFLDMCVFGLLLFDGEFADSYDFFSKKDEFKASLPIGLTVSAPFIIALAVCVCEAFGITLKNNASEDMALFVPVLIFFIIAVKFLKDLGNFRNTRSKLDKVIKFTKPAIIFEETERSIKFTEES